MDKLTKAAQEVLNWLEKKSLGGEADQLTKQLKEVLQNRENNNDH